jgi:hypothetical protein
VAFNSFAVYHSREAYVYAPILFGYFMYAAGLLDLRAQLLDGKTPRMKSLVFFGFGIVFSCYSQVTGAFIVATGAVYLFWLIWRCRKKFTGQKPPFITVFAVHALPVFPLLFVPWGYGALMKQILGVASTSKQGVDLSGGNALFDTPLMLLRMTWGTTPAALVLLALSIAAAGIALAKTKDRRIGLLFFFVIFEVFVFVVTRPIAQATFEPRYLSGAFPFIAALLVDGLFRLPQLIPAVKNKTAAGVFCTMIGVLFYSYPTFEVTQLTGKAIPYWDIVRWADANLGDRAPVLVDRWYEPWNEMRAHPSTNAIFTFTVPNEPLENYLQFHWRDTAINFFSKFPDAAYLEIAKTYFDAPGVGPWTWPGEYFGHIHAITNQAGMVLRKWGVASRGDFYAPNTNRLVVTFFYNTREDMLGKFRKSGQPLHWLFAGGWGYEKSGPMEMFRLRTREFMDWRLINEEAKLELINLSASPQQATLTIGAVAAAGTKTVECSAGGNRQTFAGNQMTEWTMSITLPPGSTTVTLRDPLWSSSPRPLFVDHIGLK